MESVIDDVKHPLVTRVSDVLRAAAAKRPRTILIDDEENLLAAVRHGVTLDTIYRTESHPLPGELAAVLPPDAGQVAVISEAVSKHLFGPQRRARVFGLARAPRPPGLAALTARAGDVLVLDGVRLMGNIGAVTRTATAFGVAGVVLVDSGLSSVMDRRLIRASRGLVFALPLVLASGDELVNHLRSQEIPLIGLDAHASLPLSQLSQVQGRVALLLGGEKAGASSTIAREAARSYFVRMNPEVESLNVSVSAALALYERRHQTWGDQADRRP